MDKEQVNESQQFRAGYVAIIGDPNVGKSTLMNALIGQKISIVTKKPQTTRHKVLGILSGEHYQIVFLDTPGLLKPKYLLQNAMMDFAQSAIEDADLVFFMIEAADPKMGPEIEHDLAFKKLKSLKKPVYLVINKIDLVKKESLLPIIDFYSKNYPFKEIFPISALKLEGTDDLLQTVVKELPEHLPYYPPDIISEHPERFFVSEIIREKIFERYREEIPYSATVDIIEFKEHAGRKDVIQAEIYVERESQKGILIGKRGKALKAIGELARKDIEVFLERPVFLQLYVKVREKWREREEWLKRLGYK
ncbi:MAG: GTPase Era [Ignavibacteriae bacterium]|nr:GTPase Era [Ignavibacteriota bacterium]